MSKVDEVREWGSMVSEALSNARSSLGAFQISTSPDGETVTFSRADGLTLFAKLTMEELAAAGSRMEAYRRILDRVVCPICHDSLIEGEAGRCGSCESRLVLELIGLRRELAA